MWSPQLNAQFIPLLISLRSWSVLEFLAHKMFTKLCTLLTLTAACISFAAAAPAITARAESLISYRQENGFTPVTVHPSLDANKCMGVVGGLLFNGSQVDM
jgi:hypothetical protein